MNYSKHSKSLKNGVFDLLKNLDEPFFTCDLPRNFFLANNSTEDNYIFTLIGMDDLVQVNYTAPKSTELDAETITQFFLDELSKQ